MKPKLRLLIVLPDGRIHKMKFPGLHRSFREAPLTATTLAGLVPSHLNYTIRIADESIQKIPFNEPFDLVAISLITGTAHRGYEIAKHFKQKGSTVVLGGVHVTLCTDEARQHADVAIPGFAENTWPQFLSDFAENKHQSFYKSDGGNQKMAVQPRRDLQRNLGYNIPNVISATRGCKGICDFCAVSAAKFGWATRDIATVIDEIKQINSKRFVFNDVSMGEDMEYFIQLLKALTPLNKKWGGLVSTKVFNHPDIYKYLKESGCSYLLIGFESINSLSLQSIKKGFNKFTEYQNIIYGLRKINVVLMGTFIFGFDEDDKYVFDNTIDFINEYKIDIPRYAIYTPFPGTDSHNRFKEQNRLLHTYWPHYDTQHVVFNPLQMSAQQLNDGFIYAYKKTFKVTSSLKRTMASGINFPITFAGNLAYNIYIKRLVAEKNRILFPDKG